MSEKLQEIAKKQNAYLEKRFSVQASRVFYKKQQVESLNSVIYGLVWIYFITAGVFLGILFVGPKAKQFSSSFKFVVLLLVVCYPYIIAPLEMFFVKFFTFIVETIAGNVWTRPDNEYSLDYTYIPMSYIPNVYSY
jgi:hypothetical protein